MIRCLRTFCPALRRKSRFWFDADVDKKFVGTFAMNEQEQMEFFFEVFDATLPRLGPGEDSSTRKALDRVLSAMPQTDDPTSATKLRILDLGCGNGAQTIQLAKYTKGTILAVDNHQPYLVELRCRAEARGVSEKIQIHCGDMADLGLKKGSFDLIWSEGALYIMGFGNGLKAYHSVLVPRGLFAVSELSWLKSDPPAECQQYFATEYPAMADVDTNLATIKASGYEVLGHFTLPQSAWWDHYYHPLEDRLAVIQKEYVLDRGRLEVIESMRVEIDTYRRYCAYYGYVFYLMRTR